MLELTRQDNQAAAAYLSQLETALDKIQALSLLYGHSSIEPNCARQGQHKRHRVLLDQVVEIATTFKA